MSDASDRINELFSVGSRDITPASARHAARVLYAPVSRDAEVSKRCLSILSDAELQRRDRLAAQGDKARFELDPRLRVVHAPPDHGGPERFSAHAIEGTGHCAALVIRSRS